MNIPGDTDETERGSALARSLDYFTVEDICHLYEITPGTAEAWRKRGKGPAHIVAGVRTLYPKAGVAEDLKARAKERPKAQAKGSL